MKTFLFVSLVATLLVDAHLLMGQELPVRWSAEVRVRGEMDGRDFQNATPPNFYTLLRARLGADIQPLENVRLFVQAQDSRAFGEETAGGRFSTIANTKNLDLHQGYLELKEIILKELSLQAGRMELAYGTERIIGAVGWNNVGRSFDGVRLTGQIPTLSLDLFVMNTAESQTPPSAATPPAVQSVRDTGQLLAGAYATIRSLEQFTIDLYSLYESNHAQQVPGFNDLSRFTLGARLDGAIGQFALAGEAAWQFGDASTASIQAYLLSLRAGYRLGERGLTNIAVGMDLLSGTPEGEARSRTFDPVFHTGHKFYGFMDYFINIPSSTRNRGILDVLGRVTARLGEPLDISFWGHVFSLAEAWKSSRELGGELDLVAALRYNAAANFELGMTAFIPGIVMREWYGGADVAFWGYLGISVRL